MIIAPQQAAARPAEGGRAIELGRARRGQEPGDLLRHGDRLDAAPISVGRAAKNDVVIDGDQYASARQRGSRCATASASRRSDRPTARTSAAIRRWTREHVLRRGDEVRVGETELRFECEGRSELRNVTDTGRKRRHNEDSYVCAPPLFAIADGMGGAQAGEIASALAADALKESEANGGGEARVTELIQEANRRVTNARRPMRRPPAWGRRSRSRSSATTDDHDRPRRRLARVPPAGGRLEQLTDDHSLVAELVRRGELSPQEAEVHPQRSVITRALGTDPDVDVDAFSIEAKPGDVYLICSDGLSDMVDSRTLEEIVRSNRDDLDATSRALVQAANRGGGDDNITAILFDVVAGDAAGATRGLDDVTREHVPIDGRPGRGGHVASGGRGRTTPPAAPRAATMVVDAAAIREAAEAAAAEPGEPEPEPEPERIRVPIWRRLLALLVILGLIAVIVVLVVWGLAR